MIGGMMGMNPYAQMFGQGTRQQGVTTGLLAPGAGAASSQAAPAPAGGLSDVQRQYMDANYPGAWDPAYWTPERFVSAFGDNPQAPTYPTVIPYTGSPTAAMGMPAGQTRDIKRYGMGPEHLFFSGANGQPYGLAAASRVAPPPVASQQDLLQQLLDRLNQQTTRTPTFNPDIAGGP